MFGIDLGSFIVILIVAIIFLGPDKFPEAMVQIVKFWRAVKSGVQDAKDTIQKEVDLSDLKNSADEYKNMVQEYTKDISSSVNVYDTKEEPLKEIGVGDAKQVNPSEQKSV